LCHNYFKEEGRPSQFRYLDKTRIGNLLIKKESKRSKFILNVALLIWGSFSSSLKEEVFPLFLSQRSRNDNNKIIKEYVK